MLFVSIFEFNGCEVIKCAEPEEGEAHNLHLGLPITATNHLSGRKTKLDWHNKDADQREKKGHTLRWE